jgi:hypothetical protein
MKAISMAALVATVGCGGAAVDPGTGTGLGGGTCFLTLTGAISASSVPCVVIVGYDSGSGQGSIGVANSSAVAGLSSFALSIATTGQPQDTTYTAANSVTGSNAAVANSGAEWVAIGGASAGSFSLTLSSMANTTSSGSQTIWVTDHGSASGTLQAVGGSATGAVNFTISF